jgi:hypothetical protein
MIKAILVLSFIVFAANGATAATGTTTGTFFEGFSQKLGLTSIQIEHSGICFQSLENLLNQLQTLIQTTEQDVEPMGMALLAFYQDAKSQLQVECQDFAMDIVSVLLKNMQPSADGQGPDVEAIIHANLETYFPQIVQQLGGMVNQLVNGQEFQAGNSAAYIIQIVVNTEKPKTTSLPASITGGKYVAFDVKKFIPKFFDAFLTALGVRTTSKGLVSCWNLVQILSKENDRFVVDAPALDLFDKLDRSAALYGKFVDTVKGCQDAFLTFDLTVGRVIRAIQKNPSKYMYQIFLNTVLQFPALEQTIQMESAYLFQGQYDLAGKVHASRLQAILKGVVTFSTVEVFTQ